MESRDRQSKRIKSVQTSVRLGRPARAILALLVVIAAPARVALAQPAPSAAPIAPPEATSQDAAPLPAPPPLAPPNVDVPAALQGRLVVVTTAAGRTEGLLTSVDDDALVVENYSQQLITIARSSVVAARLLNPPHAAEEATWAHPGPPLDGPGASASPWGYWGSLSLGPVWGQSSGSATPAGTFALDFAVSYHFVYVGAGFGLIWFDGAGSFSNETTGGTLSSGGPVSGEGHAELGLTHGIFFPTSDAGAIELRPGVGIGVMAISSATQGIDHCVDCDSRTYDYNSAPYVRFQLGVFRSTHPEGSVVHRVFMSQNGTFWGGTVSFQEFFDGASPRLEKALLFALTIGKGP